MYFILPVIACLSQTMYFFSYTQRNNCVFLCSHLVAVTFIWISAPICSGVTSNVSLKCSCEMWQNKKFCKHNAFWVAVDVVHKETTRPLRCWPGRGTPQHTLTECGSDCTPWCQADKTQSETHHDKMITKNMLKGAPILTTRGHYNEPLRAISKSKKPFVTSQRGSVQLAIIYICMDTPIFSFTNGHISKWLLKAQQHDPHWKDNRPF